jgi:competence protein ComEA
MKWLKAYTSFTRTERMGIVALLSIIVILIVIKATMHLWVHPEYDTAKEKELAAKWEAAKNKGAANVATISNNTAINTSLFPFDPNTIDASGLKQLGLSEKTIKVFLNWRNKGKRFNSKEDFKELYTLSDEDYKRLAPYITIQQHKINLNTADSVMLVSLPGIGAKLAHKILDYKKEIGKYSSVEQLLDVHHFSDSTMQILRQRLTTN